MMLRNYLCFYVINIDITYAFRLLIHFRAYDLQMDSLPHLPQPSLLSRYYFITGTSLELPTTGRYYCKNVSFCWFWSLASAYSQSSPGTIVHSSSCVTHVLPLHWAPKHTNINYLEASFPQQFWVLIPYFMITIA